MQIPCPPPLPPPLPLPCACAPQLPAYQPPPPIFPPQNYVTPSNDCCCQCGTPCQFHGRARTHGARIFSALAAEFDEDPTCNNEKLRKIIESVFFIKFKIYLINGLIIKNKIIIFKYKKNFF